MQSNRDIVVIGGSTGATDVICRILDGLPKQLEATVFIVIHAAPDSLHLHGDIFSGRTALPVQYANDRDPIELGKIYLAPADHHMLIKPGEIRIVHGPKENGFRPAIDPLFRSASTTYDGRVIGVIVSGALDDGTHGLLQIKRAGGIVIVQSPDEAAERSMPESAINRVRVDYVRPADEIGPLIHSLITDTADVSPVLGDDETDVSEGLISALRISDPGPPSQFICPECNGALWEVNDEGVLKYRCHVGHGFGADTLLMNQATEIEAALWSAVRGFEERAILLKRTANSSAGGSLPLQKRLLESARDQEQMADLVRSILMRPRRIEKPRVGDQLRKEYDLRSASSG